VKARLFRCFAQGLIYSVFLLLSLLVGRLLAQEFRVTEIHPVQDSVELGFQSSTSAYYQVWASDSLTGEWTLIRGMTLGAEQTQSWLDSGIIDQVNGLFYRVRRVPLDQPFDEDGDGIDDVYELRYPILDPLNPSDANADPDSDGLDNLDEYSYNTDPTQSDTDGDDMADGWEVGHGFDPTDDADMMSDPDADGFGNVYEYAHGTDPTNATSFPSPTIIVDPNGGAGSGGSKGGSGRGGRGGVQQKSFTCIQDALDAATNQYEIIQLSDGVYTGERNKKLAFPGQPVMLISTNGPENCVIDLGGEGRGVSFIGAEDRRWVLRGVTIRNGRAGAIYILNSSPSLEYLHITNNKAIYNYGNEQWGNGGGIQINGGSPHLENCRIEENLAPHGSGGGIYCMNGAEPWIENTLLANNQAERGGSAIDCIGSAPRIVNCTIVDSVSGSGAAGVVADEGSVLFIENSIIWSNGGQQISASSATVTYSCVQGGYAGSGNIPADPKLTSDYHLKEDSPCIDAGSASNAPPRDADGEGRTNQVDIGMDEYWDTDGDGMADAWELEHFGDLVSHDGTGDGDSDGLNDLAEYQHNCDPALADTDGDGLNDGLEVNSYGTRPDTEDTDGDGMSDGWEVTNGLAPLDDSDAMTDSDNDGYGNVYEYVHGTDPNVSTSAPEPTLYVDASASPGGTGTQTNPFNTIQQALDAASNDYDIVQLAAGTYSGTENTGLDFGGRVLMLVSENGAGTCIIDCEGTGNAFSFHSGEDERSVVCGLTLRGGANGAIFCWNAAPMIERCLIVCNSARTGGGINCHYASPTIRNCTIAGNRAVEEGGGVFCDDASSPVIHNSIVWDNSPDQISTSGAPLVTYSCVPMGYTGLGNIHVDAKLIPASYHLKADSPCIDAGSASNAPATDMDGEEAWDDPAHSNVVSIVDIGADEFVDADGDGMADAWEVRYFGDLTHTNDADEDSEGGPDGLDNLAEYENGTDPTKADTDADGLTDGDEVNTYRTSPLDVDTDGDEMPDGWEVTYGLLPLDPTDAARDWDDDQYFNFYEYIHGTDPTQSTSTPSPAIYVDISAPSGGDGSATNPFNTIQAALDAASDYEIIQVATGTYSGTGNKDLDFGGKPLMLCAEGSRGGCVIDCGLDGRGFCFTNGEDVCSIVDGFEVVNGSLGAIYCYKASPTIRNCIIQSNRGSCGGGLVLLSSTSRVQSCIIAHNRASAGGGVYAWYSAVVLENCTLAHNDALFSGGGIFAGTSNVIVRNSILWGNLPDQLAGRTAVVSYCCVEGGYSGPGNFTNHPAWAPGTYRLTANSPCIDAGSSNAPAHDIDAEERWDDPAYANVVSIVDIGADEFVDTDGDGMADAWEVEHFTNLVRNGTGDADSEGLLDLDEYENGMDPNASDTDGDGMEDDDEVTYRDGLAADTDTDGDGLMDADEYWRYGSDPSMMDTDGDGLNDGFEVTNIWTHYERREHIGNWPEALADAILHGGYLATIMSTGEETRIMNAFPDSLPDDLVWIGATDEGEEGTWSWVTGEGWAYENWISWSHSATDIMDYAYISSASVDGGLEWDDADFLAEAPYYLLEITRCMDPASRDSDGDGSSDDWEMKYHFNPTIRDNIRVTKRLINGGFDQGSPTSIFTIVGWDHWGGTNGEVSSSTVHTGAHAVVLKARGEGLETGLFQDFDVYPGEELIVSGYILTPSGSNQLHEGQVGVIAFELYEDDGDCISIKKMKLTASDAPDVWHGFALTNYIPPHAGYGRVALKLENRGYGHVYFDTLAVGVSSDIDWDNLPDWWEEAYFGGATNADANADTDGDHVTNFVEYINGTNPWDDDTDDDNLPDAWELDYGFDPLVAADGDQDADLDGLTNYEELQAGTNPREADSDGDGLSDYEEAVLGFTNATQFASCRTIVQTVNGSQATNMMGSWTVEGAAIYARERNGYLEYEISVPSNGFYVLEVEGTQHNPLTVQDKFDLTAYVDGWYVGRHILEAPYGAGVSVRFYLPRLASGAHSVRIEWKNLRPNTFLAVTAVRVVTVGGPDDNTNGTPDWIDTLLAGVFDLAPVSTNSLTSPICVEGKSRYPHMVTVKATYVPPGETSQVVTLKRGPDDAWYADVLLSPTNLTQIEVIEGNRQTTYTNAVTWTELNTVTWGTNIVSVRKGDALLLNAYPPGATGGAGAIEIVGVTNYTTTVNNAVPHKFVSAGLYLVAGTYTNGAHTTNGEVTVEVVDASFPGDPACMLGIPRVWDCPNVSTGVVVEHDARLDVESRALAGGGRRFRLTTWMDEPLYMVARLGDEGPVLDNAAVSGIPAYQPSYWKVVQTFRDGSHLVEARIFLGNIPDDLTMELHIFVGGVTFDDGTIDRVVTAADFNEFGEYTYYMIQSADTLTSTCHSTKIYQDGDYIGDN